LAAPQASEPQPVLREFQQWMLAEARSMANCIMVAPTGAGKTRVAIEHARYILQSYQDARVVFLAPHMSLAVQQAGARWSSPDSRLSTLPALKALVWRGVGRA
jgi:ERCC4-related helicase